MDADKTCEAEFEFWPTLTIIKQGTGSGTVTSGWGIDCGSDCSEAYSMGTLVWLTATPHAGSVFEGFSGPDDCSDGVVSMIVDVTCTATFNLWDSATIPTAEGDVTISISGGGFSTQPEIVDPGADIPDGFSTPYGAISFDILTEPGDTVTVTLTFPEDLPAGTTLFKCMEGACSEITDVTISGKNAAFDVTDGGALDEDLTVNGEVSDPCALAVPAYPELAVDIKPQSCPNPLNINSKGVLPVAITGAGDFDVTWIDPESIILMGISPLRWSLEDVAAPYEPFTGKEEATDCTDAGPDGLPDLTLKFNAPELLHAIEMLYGPVIDREVLTLKLNGKLRDEFGGTEFTGEDVVVILKTK